MLDTAACCDEEKCETKLHLLSWDFSSRAERRELTLDRRYQAALVEQKEQHAFTGSFWGEWGDLAIVWLSRKDRRAPPLPSYTLHF